MRLTLWRLFLADNLVHVRFILENSPNMDFFFYSASISQDNKSGMTETHVFSVAIDLECTV